MASSRESTRPPETGQTAYPAEKARGGRIILDTRARRMTFFAGLAGALVLALLLGLLAVAI